MKKFLFIVIFLLSAVPAFLQSDVTRFLGIPVSGSRSEMVEKICEKGFQVIHDEYGGECLAGVFNGYDVLVYVMANDDEVFRVAVVDRNTVKQADVIARFNTLCKQFENNPRYFNYGSQSIPMNESVFYNMAANNKIYFAVFYQKPLDARKAAAAQRLPQGDQKKVVWFRIDEYYGEFFISMYYDNPLNQANGEDL